MSILGSIVPWYVKYFKQIVVLVVVATAGAYIMYQKSEITKLEEKLATLTHDSTVQRTNDAAEISGLRGGIDIQNKKVAEMHAQSLVADQIIATANYAASKARADADAKVNKILAGVKPKDCPAAMQYLVDSAIDSQWFTAPVPTPVVK